MKNLAQEIQASAKTCYTVEIFKIMVDQISEIGDYIREIGECDTTDDVSLSAYELFSDMMGEILPHKHFALLVNEEYKGTPTDCEVYVFDDSETCNNFIKVEGQFSIPELSDDELENERAKRSEISFADLVNISPYDWTNPNNYTVDSNLCLTSIKLLEPEASEYFGIRMDELPEYGTRMDELPEYGIRMDELPQYGIRMDELPEHGIRMDELPQYGIRMDELPNYGLTMDEVNEINGFGIRMDELN